MIEYLQNYIIGYLFFAIITLCTVILCQNIGHKKLK